jgi:hypothetical protein
MWLGVTMPASPDDVAAVLRTAIVLGRNLKMSVAVELPGEAAIQIEANDCVAQGAMDHLLETVVNRIRRQVSRKGDVVLEIATNAASFLSLGEISLRVRGLEASAKRPVAR